MTGAFAAKDAGEEQLVTKPLADENEHLLLVLIQPTILKYGQPLNPPAGGAATQPATQPATAETK